MNRRFWALTAGMAVLAVIVVLAVSRLVPMDTQSIVAYSVGGVLITVIAMVAAQRSRSR